MATQMIITLDVATGNLVSVKDEKGNSAKATKNTPPLPGKKKLKETSHSIVLTDGSTCIWFQDSSGDWHYVCS